METAAKKKNKIEINKTKVVVFFFWYVRNVTTVDRIVFKEVK